jgi:hypothetical protein
MKKILCLAVVAALFVSGCTFIQNTIGALNKAQDIICSPSVDQVADAIQAVNFINANPAVKLAVGTGIATFLNIRDRVCVNIPQIQAALAAFDAAMKQAKIKAVPTSRVPELAALRAMVK